jgi:hypothetical protein
MGTLIGFSGKRKCGPSSFERGMLFWIALLQGVLVIRGLTDSRTLKDEKGRCKETKIRLQYCSPFRLQAQANIPLLKMHHEELVQKYRVHSMTPKDSESP